MFNSCVPPQSSVETGITNLSQITADKNIDPDPCYTKDY